MLNKRIKAAYLFENGNLAAIDTDGQQVPELQGAYSIDTHKRIILESTDYCSFTGFEILPSGFLRTVNSYCDYFRSKNMSWEEINEL